MKPPVFSNGSVYTPTPLHKRSGVIGRRDAEVLFPALRLFPAQGNSFVRVWWMSKGVLRCSVAPTGYNFQIDTFECTDWTPFDFNERLVNVHLPLDVYEAIVCEQNRLRFAARDAKLPKRLRLREKR